MQLGTDKFEVYLYVADSDGECTYATEHRFLERPDAETVKVLFDEAKRHFRLVYDGDAEPGDFAVRVRHLDPDDEDDD
jgi:hypothetical protein